MTSLPHLVTRGQAILPRGNLLEEEVDVLGCHQVLQLNLKVEQERWSQPGNSKRKKDLVFWKTPT